MTSEKLSIPEQVAIWDVALDVGVADRQEFQDWLDKVLLEAQGEDLILLTEVSLLSSLPWKSYCIRLRESLGDSDYHFSPHWQEEMEACLKKRILKDWQSGKAGLSDTVRYCQRLSLWTDPYGDLSFLEEMYELAELGISCTLEQVAEATKNALELS